MELRDSIKQKLIERGAPLFGKKPEEITEEMAFVQDLRAKSVHYSQIITYLEDAFDVEIPYMEFRRKATVKEAIDYVLDLVENE